MPQTHIMVSSYYTVLAICSFLSTAYGLPARKCSTQAMSHRGQVLTVEQLQTDQPTISPLASNSNATLQYVGLGLGVQNYTCASKNAAPKSDGAIATLFDITDYLEGTSDLTSNLSMKYLKAYQNEACWPNNVTLTDDTCQENINSELCGFDILGKHYFAEINGTGVPSFDIYDRAFLSAVKAGDVHAPPNAYAGKDGVCAVDWLFLPSDGSSRTYGLSEVYRINTAGGTPRSDACSKGNSTISIKYAAEYWFYL